MPADVTEKGYPIPPDEDQRLAALLREGILDTAPDPRMDQIVQITAALMNAPIALVSLVDGSRQWFKAKIGLDVDETPREQAFCAHTILSSQPLIIQDAALDDRFKQNPLVVGPPFIRSYTGAPILTREGYRLGSLCAIDRRPNVPTGAQIQALVTLAGFAASLLVTYRQLEAAYDRLADVHQKNPDATHLREPQIQSAVA